MAQYLSFAPVTLSIQLTLDAATAGGKCRVAEDSVVLLGASGPGAEHFNVVVTKWGDLLALDTRLAKGRDAKPAAPAPAPAPAKAPTKGKGKAVPVAPAPTAPAAPATPDLAAMMAMLQSLMAAQQK
jgi:hypothetical protein